MIENLLKFRKDGQVIHDGDSIDQIKALGPISLVTRVQWKHDGQTLERSNPFGVFAKPLPKRDALLCIEPHDERNDTSTFTVVNADGSVRFEVPPVMEIEGAPRRVTFMHTCPNVGHNNAAFAVVVDAPSAEAQFRVTIDAHSGEILDIRFTK